MEQSFNFENRRLDKIKAPCYDFVCFNILLSSEDFTMGTLFRLPEKFDRSSFPVTTLRVETLCATSGGFSI